MHSLDPFPIPIFLSDLYFSVLQSRHSGAAGGLEEKGGSHRKGGLWLLSDSLTKSQAVIIFSGDTYFLADVQMIGEPMRPAF